MKTLIIASHPDDEVLGCGGTIAKLTGAGHEVHVLILGEGATSRYDAREDADAAVTAELEDASRKAADILGVTDLTFGQLPDNRFDTIALLDIVKRIEKSINAIQPGTVFTQHGGDLNIDHATTFRAVMTAVRPMQDSPVKALYSYAVASSSEWAFDQFAPRFRPDYFIDITDQLDAKIAAMRAYESEAGQFPHPRSAKALTAQAVNTGVRVGMEAAEAFMTIFRKEQ